MREARAPGEPRTGRGASVRQGHGRLCASGRFARSMHLGLTVTQRGLAFLRIGAGSHHSWDAGTLVTQTCREGAKAPAHRRGREAGFWVTRCRASRLAGRRRGPRTRRVATATRRCRASPEVKETFGERSARLRSRPGRLVAAFPGGAQPTPVTGRGWFWGGRDPARGRGAAREAPESVQCTGRGRARLPGRTRGQQRPVARARGVGAARPTSRRGGNGLSPFSRPISLPSLRGAPPSHGARLPECPRPPEVCRDGGRMPRKTHFLPPPEPAELVRVSGPHRRPDTERRTPRCTASSEPSRSRADFFRSAERLGSLSGATVPSPGHVTTAASGDFSR